MHTQEEAIEAIRRGENVFISGPAGTGKSYIINNSFDDNKTVIMCSYTGIASLNIGGATCSSLFGLPVGLITEKDKYYVPEKLREIFGNSGDAVLVIDEVGTLRADYFDLMNEKLQVLRGNDLPFGGIQIVIVGDLYQLPPILGKNEAKIFRRQRYKSVWVFHAKIFEACNFKNIVLTKIYRQDNPEQVEVLNNIREGINLEGSIKKINTWCTEDLKQERLNLCTYNRDADGINIEEFNKNTNPIKKYKGAITGKFKATDYIASKEIELKIGLRVIICANGLKYRNGEMGEILAFKDELVTVRKDDGDIVEVEPFTWETFDYTRGVTGSIKKTVKGSLTQIPLKLGYSISIHKSQGMTLDNLYIDFGYKVRSEGLVYVALSRARDLDNVYLKRDLEVDDVLVDENVKRYYERLL